MTIILSVYLTRHLEYSLAMHIIIERRPLVKGMTGLAQQRPYYAGS